MRTEIALLSPLEKANYYTTLFFLAIIYTVYFLIFLFPFILQYKRFSKKIKFKKRFLGGCILGFFVSKFITHKSRANSFYSNLKNGIIYGYWGVTIIGLDYIQDSGLLNEIETRENINTCLKILNAHLLATTTTDRLEVLASQKLCYLLSKSTIKKSSSQKEFFLKATQQLLEGQYNSLKQKILDPNMDFNWYVSMIVDQKTLNFFLAPIHLYQDCPVSYQNYNKLYSAFLSLNNCYRHWQLIDDVADVEKDASDSLITAPGYILLSQGKIALKIKNLYISNSHPEILIRNEIKDSKLFCSFDLDGQINHEVNVSYSLNDAIKCCIGNCVDDFNMELGALIDSRIALKNNFEESFQKNDTNGVLQAIYLGKCCERILDQTHHKEAIKHLKTLLSSEHYSLSAAMYTLNMMINNCFLKAVTITNSHNSLYQ